MDGCAIGLDWGHEICPWSLPFVFFVGDLEVVFVAPYKIELWEGIDLGQR